MPRYRLAFYRKAGARALFIAAFAALLGAPAQAEVYRLAAQDKVSLRVYEYRASIGDVYEWKSLTGEFTLGAGGEISLPLVGFIQASGLTTGELGAAIATQMSQTIGLAAPPFVAVEVTQYRPYYIVGGVDKPGEYPYRPGLTVLKALGIAGGLPRLSDTGVLRIRRELIAQRGDVQQLGADLQSLTVRRARLLAEIGDAEAITLPPELDKRKTEPGLARVIQQETSIFNARRTALRTELAALNGLKDYLAKEVVSLQSQIEAQKKERSLVQKELDNISSLVERGLAVSPRQLGLERTMAQLEGERLRMETTLLKAQQDISRTEISILEASNRRATELTIDLRETEAKLEQTRSKFSVADKLLYDAQATAPALAGGRRSDEAQPVFTILRGDGAAAKEFNAAEGDPVQPGDTVKVTIPAPEDALTELLGTPN
ncbi:MAG: polysaccharide biosynthesis/export family protein [Hyphomicrobiales bacterium]|nr:polysaccharide biosynthesis/export family protein [Hyphomicrobiales bacterium]